MQIKTTILLVVIAILGSGIVYKYFDLTGDIEDRDKTILELRTDLSDTERRLTTEEGNVASLKHKIDERNKEIERKALANKKLKEEFIAWQNKPAKIKYVNKVVREIVTETKYEKGNCEDGLELNRKIAQLDYETIDKIVLEDYYED